MFIAVPDNTATLFGMDSSVVSKPRQSLHRERVVFPSDENRRIATVLCRSLRRSLCRSFRCSIGLRLHGLVSYSAASAARQYREQQHNKFTAAILAFMQSSPSTENQPYENKWRFSRL
jgi:hypothetical protein